MTTVIRAIGANFSNVDLPYLSDLVKDGLVAAYRPNNTENGLLDLSGNNNALTVKGAPTLSATGMVGDALNGYKTQLPETVSLTYIVVFKCPTATINAGGFTLNCFSDALTQGSSIYTTGAPNQISAQSRVFNSGTSSNIATNIDVASVGNDYVFVALTVDATNETQKIYVPSLDYVGDINLAGGSVKNRVLATPKVELVSNTDRPTFLSKTHLSEALIYNKALTDAQIQQQYQKSKTYMQTIGITI